MDLSNSGGGNRKMKKSLASSCSVLTMRQVSYKSDLVVLTETYLSRENELKALIGKVRNLDGFETMNVRTKLVHTWRALIGQELWTRAVQSISCMKGCLKLFTIQRKLNAALRKLDAEEKGVPGHLRRLGRRRLNYWKRAFFSGRQHWYLYKFLFSKLEKALHRYNV